MRTWLAALTHVILGLITAAGALAFFAPNTDLGKVINQGIDPDVGLGSAIASTLLQVYVAVRNSNSDPNGKPLALIAKMGTVYKTVTDSITGRD